MSRWATRFRRRQYLKGSLWALPLCGCVIGVLLAQLLLWIDSTVHIKALMHYSSSTATGVLTAIIGAMVALLGFVVTIGVLVIQQATATLSPRFMRLWYRDRLQKVVLATFAGTFIRLRCFAASIRIPSQILALPLPELRSPRA